MAAIDAEKRELILLGEFMPSEDPDADMIRIKAHYEGLKGINPANF